MIAWIVILVLLVVVLVVVALGMRTGWRNRARWQSVLLPDFEQPPPRVGEEEPLLPELTGVYVGSTFAGDWQDRVALGDVGLRAAAVLRLSRAGLLVERTGASPLWIGAQSLLGARTGAALAGKVMGGDGLLLVRWRHGEQELDMGFRGDDKAAYGSWVAAVTALTCEFGSSRGGVNGGKR